MDSFTTGIVTLTVAIGVVCVVGIVAYLYYFQTWFRAHVGGVNVSLLEIVGMSMRRVPAHKVVNAYIAAHAGHVDVTLKELEEHVAASGNVRRVVEAMIVARDLGVELSLGEARAIDLQGRDVVDEVHAIAAEQSAQGQGIG